LRRERLTIRTIAGQLDVPISTLRQWLASQGLSRLPPLDPPPPVQRYEHAAPGDLLHLDIKKLGRIVRPGHRVTGNPRDNVDGADWECVHVATDDHSRVGFSQGHPDETAACAIIFLRAAVAYYGQLGVTIHRLLTDNGSAYRSKAFAAVCHELGIKHRFTRPYTPRTNGKAERFIQTALREWAYAVTIRPAPNAKRLCNRGCIVTITIDLIPPSAINHPSAGFRGTTYRISTLSQVPHGPGLLRIARSARQSRARSGARTGSVRKTDRARSPPRAGGRPTAPGRSGAGKAAACHAPA
jgi:transposase InsO family protein